MSDEMKKGDPVWLGRLYVLVSRDAPQLLPSLRWLAGGGETAEILFPGLCKAPSVERTEQLLEFARELDLPEVTSLVEELVAGYEYDAQRVDAVIDAMEERELDSWVHPVHVVPRPWPFDRLIRACKLRSAEASAPRRRKLESIVEKLERAYGIERGARERRAKMREGRDRGI